MVGEIFSATLYLMASSFKFAQAGTAFSSDRDRDWATTGLQLEPRRAARLSCSEAISADATHPFTAKCGRSPAYSKALPAEDSEQSVSILGARPAW